MATPRSTSAPGMPMGITATSPAQWAAGWRRSARFQPAKVAVSRALIAGPMISALSALSPDGRSSATTGARDSLTASITEAVRPRAGPSSPVPRSPSTRTSALRAASPTAAAWAAVRISSTRPRHRLSAWAASPLTSARRPTSSTLTLAPRALRWRATTKPSPPLFPFPQRTSTPLPSMGAKRSAISRAAPAPAASMRRGPGMPSWLMARESRARISAAVNTGSMATSREARGGARPG